MATVLALFHTVATAQVKIGENPTQIVGGAKLQVDGNSSSSASSKLIVTGNGNIGMGMADPGTNLDVKGAITNRETEISIASNAASIPLDVSQVRLTGAATATITITAVAPPNPGQRLVVYNNTTGGFGALLNNFYIPAGQAVEFSYSNGNWRAQQVKYAQVFRTKIASTHVTTSGSYTALPFDATFTNPNIVYNTILGATVGTNNITLPPGMYRASASVFFNFNTAQPAGNSKYTTLELNFSGSSYNTFGWFMPGITTLPRSTFINGTCIFKVTAATTVGLQVWTTGVNATDFLDVAGGGITLNIFEIEKLD